MTALVLSILLHDGVCDLHVLEGIYLLLIGSCVGRHDLWCLLPILDNLHQLLTLFFLFDLLLDLVRDPDLLFPVRSRVESHLVPHFNTVLRVLCVRVSKGLQELEVLGTSVSFEAWEDAHGNVEGDILKDRLPLFNITLKCEYALHALFCAH